MRTVSQYESNGIVLAAGQIKGLRPDWTVAQTENTHLRRMRESKHGDAQANRKSVQRPARTRGYCALAQHERAAAQFLGDESCAVIFHLLGAFSSRGSRSKLSVGPASWRIFIAVVAW